VTGQEPEERPAVTAERLVFFTDAIVAIAITLLVLPLLESIPEAASRGEATGPWLSEHASGLLAFFVSFAIVASTWSGHHRLFQNVSHLSRTLTWLNIGWALSIVFLQLPSSMIYQLPQDRWGPVLYVSTLLVSWLSLAGMSAVIARHPELLEAGTTTTLNTRGYVAVSVLFAVVLVHALVDPNWAFAGLFLLVLIPVGRRIPLVARGNKVVAGRPE
jgi:uncharacterized membrane protein